MDKRIGIVGTRGLPPKYGGFETWADQLQTGLGSRFDFVIVGEKGTRVSDYDYKCDYREVSLMKGKATVIYYLLSLLRVKDCDVILVVGLGAAWLYPLRVFFSKKILITNIDGLEWKRSRFNRVGRLILRLYEHLAVSFSDYVVSDSTGITTYLQNTYGSSVSRKIRQIEYAAPKMNYRVQNNENYKYSLLVARLVPENNIEMIANAYNLSSIDYKLLIVGNVDNDYFKNTLNKYTSDKVEFIGGVYDKSKLTGLRIHAEFSFHGHSVGGTNPSLLEAMVAGRPIIAHDNEFNRATLSSTGMFFKDVGDLRDLLNDIHVNKSLDFWNLGNKLRNLANEQFSEEIINKKYEDFFNELKFH